MVANSEVASKECRRCAMLPPWMLACCLHAPHAAISISMRIKQQQHAPLNNKVTPASAPRGPQSWQRRRACHDTARLRRPRPAPAAAPSLCLVGLQKEWTAAWWMYELAGLATFAERECTAGLEHVWREEGLQELPASHKQAQQPAATQTDATWWLTRQCEATIRRQDAHM